MYDKEGIISQSQNSFFVDLDRASGKYDTAIAAVPLKTLHGKNKLFMLVEQFHTHVFSYSIRKVLISDSFLPQHSICLIQQRNGCCLGREGTSIML